MSNIEITNLTKKDTDNVIEIFSTAFKNYPLMEFFFKDTYEQSMKHLLKSMCDEKSIVENLLLGAFLEEKLQGVAFITPPKLTTSNDNTESTKTASEEQFAIAIGEEALMRIEAYSNLKKTNKPSSPHFYINTLGVHPQSHGKGIGSALLSQVHQMSQQHSDSQGVALDTQTQKNVGYYQRFGYGISNTVKLENVENWFMFRPN
ncbi:GNAT family N-acetyltransferase [Rivularia sp. UHCC 0363]|uniref:GNAT family N-acetyltransferase n=1 Tax=Rivularia sp. UHCC 0363 TaxID=3110244 RepID=UPI002B1FA7FA|nr:GNAT family N-acetyltransferase [Rivularia sp. UHCC 0363]MEA5599381.1 GNAT family N-acetyltransferase [Rivularia sp. UHCC 0363]